MGGYIKIKPEIKKSFPQLKKSLLIFMGIMVATAIGFLEGVGIESAITDQIIGAIKKGDVVGIIGYVAIFLLIWIQVKSLRRSVDDLRKTIASVLSSGESRFEVIEHRQNATESRLTALEQKTRG